MSKRQTNVDWDFSNAKLTNVGVPSANGHVMRYDEFGATNWNQMTTTGIPTWAGLNLTYSTGLKLLNGASVLGQFYYNGGVVIDRLATTNFYILEGGSAQVSVATSTGNVGLLGKISTYNNIATVSGGVPSILGTADLTGQTAAKAATTIYTPTATGLFRISAYLQVTTSNSFGVLGGSTGVVITFTDGDGSVAQSVTVDTATNAGTPAITVGAMATTVNLNGEIVIYAKTGVAIQYAIGYTGGSGTPMAYAAHLKVEAL